MNFSSKLMLLVCVVVVNSKVSSTPLEKAERSLDKRSLKNFGAMIECEAKMDKWKLNGYGCWCGYGGAGEPLDGIDRCCYVHDKCYDALIAGDECTTTVDPYLISYKFSKCSDCALASDYTYFDRLGWVTVACRVNICACDSAAAKCFAQNIYDNSLASHDKSGCGEDTNA